MIYDMCACTVHHYSSAISCQILLHGCCGVLWSINCEVPSTNMQRTRMFNGLLSMATLSIISVALWYSIWLAGKSLNYMVVAEFGIICKWCFSLPRVRGITQNCHRIGEPQLLSRHNSRKHEEGKTYRV